MHEDDYIIILQGNILHAPTGILKKEFLYTD